MRLMRRGPSGEDAAYTYADHRREWDAARATIAEARELLVPDEHGTVSFVDLAVWFHKHGNAALDGLENLLDATAFKDRAALHRQTEIVQRLGAGVTPEQACTCPNEDTRVGRCPVHGDAARLREAHIANGDKSGGKASYWLRRAGTNLDCAVQCCGTEDSIEIDAMETRCDELADKLAEMGR